MQSLNTQLSELLEQVKNGLSGDPVVRQLQSAIDTLGTIATQDALTGALNRRGMMQVLDAELDRAKRTGHPFSFAVISVDQFHLLNEQFGSAISDQVLKNLTQAALGLIRSLDSFARISPNEFGWLLPTTWLDQSENAINRLTGAVGVLDWAALVPSLHVTFSSGVTTNLMNDTAEKMIIRAGQALIMAKAKGPGSSARLESALPDFDPGIF